MTGMYWELQSKLQHFLAAMPTKPSTVRRKQSERRRSGRQLTAIPARLLVPRARAIPCTIVALSTEGACLTLEAKSGMPANLRMRAGGSVYRVQATERGTGYVFVKFRR